MRNGVMAFQVYKENGQIDLDELHKWHEAYKNAETPEWIVQQTHQMMFEDGYKGEIDVWTLCYPPERIAVHM